MKRSVILTFAGLACIWILTGDEAQAATKQSPAEDQLLQKEFVNDGSIVHDVGMVYLNITNYGLIGAAVSAEWPSARWPGETGDDHLYAAGLWVGGIVLGERLVSTGQYAIEFQPTEDPLDTIYTMATGDPGGARYPELLPDDDGDGLEDEDPKNGLDDDGDSLIDEDFAAISDQHFRCVNSDLNNLIEFPDHTPMGLKVTQQTFQWSDPWGENFVGIDFTIRNVGVVEISDVYVGMFADCDIPAEDNGSYEDLAGTFAADIMAANGESVPVEIGYMFDAAQNPLPGYIGCEFLSHTTDPSGVSAPTVAALTSLQIIRGSLPFDEGGDPTNDHERYELLSSQSWDTPPPVGHEDDYRFLIASGPFPSLAPGEEISYQVALVMGNGLEHLLFNAANAQMIYNGASFDRDGDPGNGQEYLVNWLHPDDVPVSVDSGSLQAFLTGQAVRLELTTSLESIVDLSVVRHGPESAPVRRWESVDFQGIRSSSQGTMAVILDEDAVGWPRQYVLMLGNPPDEYILDEITFDPAAALKMDLVASPNPFNPQVEIKFGVPVAGLVQMDIFDAKGRLVRNLVHESRPAGSYEIVWRGTDSSGRAVASGVYHVQLNTGQGWARRAITLVR